MSTLKQMRRKAAQRAPIHVACEELNFVWQANEVKEFRKCWSRGDDIRDIAKSLKRPVEEVAILIMDQAKLGMVRKRPTGIFGI